MKLKMSADGSYKGEHQGYQFRVEDCRHFYKKQRGRNSVFSYKIFIFNPKFRKWEMIANARTLQQAKAIIEDSNAKDYIFRKVETKKDGFWSNFTKALLNGLFKI